MAQNASVSLRGSLASGGAGCGGCGGGAASEVLPLSFSAVYGGSKEAAPTIDSSDFAPFVIPLEGILKVRVLGLVVRSGSGVRLKLTSPNGGADQVMPVSSRLLLHNPSDGDELTVIKIVGQAEVSYFIAGDVA